MGCSEQRALIRATAGVIAVYEAAIPCSGRVAPPVRPLLFLADLLISQVFLEIFAFWPPPLQGFTGTVGWGALVSCSIGSARSCTLGAAPGDQSSGARPACFMTRAHISASVFRNAPTCSGASGRLSYPSGAKRPSTLGPASAAMVSAFIFQTISVGVLDGT